MTKEESKFNITPGTDHLTITHIDGLTPERPHPFRELGRIDTVSSFIIKRKDRFYDKSAPQALDNDVSVVVVDLEKGSIKLTIDPNDRYSNEITGQLVPNKELEDFKINTAKLYDRDELLKLIRFNAYRIKEPGKLITELRNLNLKASIESKNQKDLKGNVDRGLTKSIVSEIPDSFILTIPVFQSMPEKTFRVEIAMDYTDASVKFWLESTELHELMHVHRLEIIETEIDLITANGLLVLYK